MEKINLARLKSCMLLAEQGGELTIGFLGGSITQGSLATGPERCYAYRVFSWWRQAFPRAAFHYVNGGIGGTTSHFGVSRAVSDVLMYQPDVVVVDFSVNDEADTFFQETFEGVIRRLLTWSSAPAVLLLNNVYYDTGKNAQAFHNAVGDWYGLPHVSIKDTLYQKMKAGMYTREELTPDGLHPNDKGHALVENGIEPYLTLYHWELPYELYKRGGWMNPQIVEWFGAYAKLVVERFSDRVTHYFTLNEPQCFVGLGFLTGEHAPGLKSPLRDTFEMAHNVLKAHGRAVQMLRQYGKQPLTIGYAPTCGMCYPETERPEDIEAARQALFSMQSDDKNWTWNVAWWSDPVLLGHYPEEGLARYEPYLPKITDADMKLIAEPIDVYGQNIYNGRCIRMGADGKAEDVKRCEGFAKTAIDWPVTPEALYWGPKFLYERYHKPIYVTENGLSCHDVVSLDKKVHDPNRIDFLARYLRELSRAADEVDLRGYFQWSLMDNFEWAKGYSERFGLVYVDYRTLERIPKDSAYWYRDVMLSNGEKL